ncbi:MAG: hypothetical protein ABJA67_05450 [Chthonomonadales bacterium]
MILIDASVLVSLADAKEKDHELCWSAVRLLETPLITTWPCLAEALYFLGKNKKWFKQKILWQIVLGL